MLITYAILVLLVSAGQVSSKTCFLNTDIVFAVDTTSSQSSNDFDAVKSELKKIATQYTVGQEFTRLALVSTAKTAHVVVHFNAINSLADFNWAVDKLSYSTETPDLSEGIKVSKNSVFNTARPTASKILIIVKDTRLGRSTVPDGNVLARTISEASLLKNLKAKIHAVGLGGLWSTEELQALYGPAYLLLKSMEKAFLSTKTFTAVICMPDCLLKGQTTPVKYGLCYGSLKLKTYWRVFIKYDNGVHLCSKELVRELEKCTEQNKRCRNLIGERSQGACNSATNKLTASVSYEFFSTIEQACKTRTVQYPVDCNKVYECPHQVADVIFLLDKSASIEKPPWRELIEATAIIIYNLKIGHDGVRVGVITFSDDIRQEILLSDRKEKEDLFESLRQMNHETHGRTMTHLGLYLAHGVLNNFGRKGVKQLVIVIMGGGSHSHSQTLAECMKIKNSNIDLYVIGVKRFGGGTINVQEIHEMTAPETADKAIILNDFSDLQPWSQKFSNDLCLKLASPIPALCDDSVFIQSVTECKDGVQYSVSTRFLMATVGGKTCIKSTVSKKSKNCIAKCVSPTDGNDYLDGDTWTSLCYTYMCDNGTPKIKSTQCRASDGTCKDVSANVFKCLDENNKVVQNCRCINKPEGATLAYDTA